MFDYLNGVMDDYKAPEVWFPKETTESKTAVMPFGTVAWNIETEAKWPRRHFQIHFLEWACVNFDKDFTEVCSQWSN